MADLYGRPIHGKALTPREREIAGLMPTASSKEIARQLDISFRTVQVHRSRIMEKTGAHNPVDVGRMMAEARMMELVADLRRSLGLSPDAQTVFDAICKRHGVTV